jgi:hypothetical protein
MCAAVSLRPAQIAAFSLALCAVLGGCGKTLVRGDEGGAGAPGTVSADGATGLSTSNTTRIGGADAAVDAAAVARVLYPAGGLAGNASAEGASAEGGSSKPQAVVLVAEDDWPAALVASVLEGAPLHAPLIYTKGFVLSPVAAQTLSALAPSGASALGGVQAVRVGEAAAPFELRLRSLGGSEPAQTAVTVERLASALRKRTPKQVIVTAWDAPPAMSAPAAGLAAMSGAPILLVRRSSIPQATRSELARLGQTSIYVVGPASAVSDAVVGELGRYGPVARISGGGPAANAIAVARFSDGSFGWGIRESGHGLVFVNPARPFDAPAAAALSASGDYAPILLLDESGRLGPALARYMSDLQPGSPAGGPVKGVYNHGWLIGDKRAIPLATQAQLNSLLEISPQKQGTEPELESTGGEPAAVP